METRKGKTMGITNNRKYTLVDGVVIEQLPDAPGAMLPDVVIEAVGDDKLSVKQHCRSKSGDLYAREAVISVSFLMDFINQADAEEKQ